MVGIIADDEKITPNYTQISLPLSGKFVHDQSRLIIWRPHRMNERKIKNIKALYFTLIYQRYEPVDPPNF